MPHSINLWKLVTGCWPNDTLSLLNAKKHWKGKTDWFDYGSSLGNLALAIAAGWSGSSCSIYTGAYRTLIVLCARQGASRGAAALAQQGVSFG
jgi:hypothetical protein